MRESGGNDRSGEAPGGVVVVGAIVGSVVWRMDKAKEHIVGSVVWRMDIAKEQSDVDEADGKDGFGSFYVLAVVDKCGEGLV